MTGCWVTLRGLVARHASIVTLAFDSMTASTREGLGPPHRQGSLGMTKMERTVVSDGDYYLVEHAMRADGSEPAKKFLDLLDVGMVEIREITNPDEKQPGYKETLLGVIFDFADGEYVPPRFYNFLNDGIWEFKSGDVRISFYDTDGEGGYEPKNWRRDSPFANAELPDDFDDFVRLGHCFAKPDRQTPKADLGLCANVREEDVTRDRD